MIDLYLDNLFYLQCNIYYLFFSIIFYIIYFFLKNWSVVMFSFNKTFFYFKIPTDTQIIANSNPKEQDLITLNCLLEKSLHSKFYFYWTNFPTKSIYERWVFSEILSKRRHHYADFFFGKIQIESSVLKVMFFQKKEKIISNYFFFQENNLNINWYKFKGYYPSLEFVNYLDNFF